MEHQYAQIATEIHAAEVMTYNACRMKENGIPFVKEASMVKLYASQVAEKAASKSIEWLGGVGFTQDLLAEKFFEIARLEVFMKEHRTFNYKLLQRNSRTKIFDRYLWQCDFYIVF